MSDAEKHEPLTRWWTHGEYPPEQIQMLQYMGNNTWLARFADDLEDSTDVNERDLYWREADALRAHLEWLYSVFYFVREWLDPGSGLMQVLTERIALTNSKLDQGR